eukprot:NODE_7744_length_1553_cov_12.003506.p1 GENE.NODE_7744_length_1553_cov_12.003506~~NODE_7744_length_1553_cov_12.003506.p1  ORF type:complete len:450 (+),score=113.73 NODE_7744_length_1553_cov_12.003506:60-1409(+)
MAPQLTSSVNNGAASWHMTVGMGEEESRWFTVEELDAASLRSSVASLARFGMMAPCWLPSSILVACDGTVLLVPPDDGAEAASIGGPPGIDAAGNGEWIEEGSSSDASSTGVAWAGAVDGNSVLDDSWADAGVGGDEALRIHAGEGAHGLGRFSKEAAAESGAFGNGSQETVLDCSLGSAALACDGWPEFDTDICEVHAPYVEGHDWMLRPVDFGLYQEAYTHDKVAPDAVWSASAVAQWDAWAGGWPACDDGELAYWHSPSGHSTVDAGRGSRSGGNEGSSAGKRSNHIRWHGRMRLPHCDVPRATNFVEPHGSEAREVTTVMIHNVPNRYTRKALVRELTSLGYKGKYDFLYLPIDRRTASSVGYAFVNFRAPEDAAQFMTAMSGHLYQGCKRRVAHATAAHLQGLEKNLRHYRKTSVLYSPARALRPLIDNSSPPVFSDSCKDATI